MAGFKVQRTSPREGDAIRLYRYHALTSGLDRKEVAPELVAARLRNMLDLIGQAPATSPPERLMHDPKHQRRHRPGSAKRRDQAPEYSGLLF